MQLNDITSLIKDLSYFDTFPVNIGGYEIEIYRSYYSEDPREWGSPFTMVCSGSGMGDEQWQPNYASEYSMFEYFHGMSGLMEDKGYYQDFTAEDLRRLSEWADQNVLWLPLYVYKHGVITMRTTPFANRWDSGCVGFIYITREDARKDWKWDRISSKREKQLYEWMRGDVEIYDKFLTGDVYGYNIMFNGEHVDSCGGYFGDHNYDSYMLDEIASMVERHYNERKKTRFEKVKALIKNNVPIIKRPQLIPNHNN